MMMVMEGCTERLRAGLRLDSLRDLSPAAEGRSYPEVVADEELVGLVDVLVELAFLRSDGLLNAVLDYLNVHIYSCICRIEMVFHPNELVDAFACLGKQKT